MAIIITYKTKSKSVILKESFCFELNANKEYGERENTVFSLKERE